MQGQNTTKKFDNEIYNNQRPPQDISNAIIRNSSSIEGKENGIRNAHKLHESEADTTTNHIDDYNAA